MNEPCPLHIMRVAGADPADVDEAAAHIARDPCRAEEVKEQALNLAYRKWPALRKHPELIQLIAMR